MMSRRQTCVIAPVGGESMNKTNVMRLLDAAKTTYRAKEYAYDENDLSGLHAAEGIGEPAEQIFKTLIARGEKQGYLVFCIPVCCELDLKKAAKARTEPKLYDAFAVYRFHVSREKHSRAVCLSELYARGWQMSSPVREKTVSVFLIAAFSQRNGLTETGPLHKMECD